MIIKKVFLQNCKQFIFLLNENAFISPWNWSFWIHHTSFCHDVWWCELLYVHFMTMPLCVAVYKYSVSHCEPDKGFSSAPQCYVCVTSPLLCSVLSSSSSHHPGRYVTVGKTTQCSSCPVAHESLLNILFFCWQSYVSFCFRSKNNCHFVKFFSGSPYLAISLWVFLRLIMQVCSLQRQDTWDAQEMQTHAEYQVMLVLLSKRAVSHIKPTSDWLLMRYLQADVSQGLKWTNPNPTIRRQTINDDIWNMPF